ncbi:hypothetical protein OsI_30957 [Oryza sativa Indica Group]|uniref:Uncharacterized protein n=1 Tax=Oryza sativa subsp. indica TaxID=39946 RepID=B8BEJ7_ORYSI|nr:hypothetical protein OsI_30957 [Oryza sativa Indica Group]
MPANSLMRDSDDAGLKNQRSATIGIGMGGSAASRHEIGGDDGGGLKSGGNEGAGLESGGFTSARASLGREGGGRSTVGRHGINGCLGSSDDDWASLECGGSIAGRARDRQQQRFWLWVGQIHHRKLRE